MLLMLFVFTVTTKSLHASINLLMVTSIALLLIVLSYQWTVIGNVKHVQCCPAVFIHSGSGGCPDVRKEHPQGDLWKKYNINFLGCQFIDRLSYNLHRRAYIEEWQER